MRKLALITLLATVLGIAAVARTVTVTAETLNVRAGPGTSYERTGQVHRGDVLVVLGESEGDDWLNVRALAGGRGWVSAAYVEPTTLASLPAAGRRAADDLGETDASTSAPGEARRLTLDQAPFDAEAIEQEMIRLINEERVAAGVPPVTPDPVLMEVARARSEDMVARNYYSHYDPETGELLAWTMLTARGGYPAAAENIGADAVLKTTGDENAASFVDGWAKSEGHRQNQLDPRCHRVGVGVALQKPGGGKAAFFSRLVATALYTP